MRVVYEERAIPVELLSRVNYLMQHNRVLMMDTLVNPGKSNVEKRNAEFISNLNKVHDALKLYAAVPRTPELEQPYQVFLDQQQKYGKEALEAAMNAMASDRFDDGQALYLDKISPMAPGFQASIEKLMDLQVRLAGQAYQGAREGATTGRSAILAIMVCALAGGILLSWLIARSITQPITDAETIATRVAEGDLRPTTMEAAGDEIGRLVIHLERMRTALANIVSDVRTGSHLIASTSGEISKGVNDLSQRTELQAANLQEASASLDQLLQSVQSHARISQEVSGVARSTESGAQAGGQSVRELVVQIQMVSEMSRKIADITNVIDAIAFQTNILALNAAVEAARAGEQGRGFAVVASEVRMLATRSATAAAEIKSLITDSVSAVGKVTSMAGTAGTQVDNVVAQVGSINELISRLNETSNLQADELHQISNAIRTIDEMTQQNAALVEENAAAADSLAKEASGLDQIVGTFRLPNNL
jgi:methyl-accepting chemotaxis protein